MYGSLGVYIYTSQGKTNSIILLLLWFVIVPRWYVVRVRVRVMG